MQTMPLTSHLKFADSPVSTFLAEHLPHHDTVSRCVIDAVRGADTIRPSGARPAWGALGHTIEYRLLQGIGHRPDYRIPGVPPLHLPGLVRAAAFGVEQAGRRAAIADGADAKMWMEVITRGIELSDELSSFPTHPLHKRDKYADRLARLLYVQAYFEDLWRSGLLVPALAKASSLDDLVDGVPQFVVDDIQAMAEKADPIWTKWLDMDGTRHVYNPTMLPRLGVPADGDAVIDGLLIDVKATVNPQRVGKTEVYQLAGYLLLDVTDKFGMRGCGLYLARQGVLVAWTLEEFLSLLTGEHMDLVGALARLTELRSTFEAHLASNR